MTGSIHFAQIDAFATSEQHALAEALHTCKRAKGDMLYLLHADGMVEELENAASGKVDEESGVLVCCDKDGAIVARYPRLAVIAFSHAPFPTEDAVRRRGKRSSSSSRRSPA